MIDIHAHFAYRDFFPDFYLTGIAEDILDRLPDDVKETTGIDYFKKVVLNNVNDRDCKKLFTQMEKAGIKQTVLLIIDFFFNTTDHPLALEEIYKAHYHIAREADGKLIIFTGIDPRRGEVGLTLLKKSIEEYGFRGLKLYPPSGFELTDHQLFPFYELCRDYQIPVLSHIGPTIKSMNHDSTFPRSIENFAENFPTLSFILGHGGILFFDESLQLMKKYKNIYADISGFQLVFHEKEMVINKVKTLLKEVPEQILFGTDWPLYNLKGSQKKWVDYFMGSEELSKDDVNRLMSFNAKKLLGIND